jgi:hypothetical protein
MNIVYLKTTLDEKANCRMMHTEGEYLFYKIKKHTLSKWIHNILNQVDTYICSKSLNVD